MTKVRMMLWVLAVVLLVSFVAAGCGSASDQTKHQDKKKVEAKGHQAKQKANAKKQETKNKLKEKGQQTKQKANAKKQESKNKLKENGQQVKQKAKQKRGSRQGGSNKGNGY